MKLSPMFILATSPWIHLNQNTKIFLRVHFGNLHLDTPESKHEHIPPRSHSCDLRSGDDVALTYEIIMGTMSSAHEEATLAEDAPQKAEKTKKKVTPPRRGVCYGRIDIKD